MSRIWWFIAKFLFHSLLSNHHPVLEEYKQQLSTLSTINITINMWKSCSNKCWNVPNSIFTAVSDPDCKMSLLFRPSCGRFSKRLSQFSELFWLLSIEPFSNHHLNISSTITQVIPVCYCQHCGMGISGPKLKAETHRGLKKKRACAGVTA